MRVYLPDKEMREAIAWLNKCAQHQQDLINSTDSCSRPLVASTHGAAKHHTKTLILKSSYDNVHP